MRRRFISTVIATVLAVAFMVTSGPASDAGAVEKHGKVRDSGCSGKLLESRKITGEVGRTLGRVELWYSTRNGGENCVITRTSVGRAEMVAALDVDMDNNKRWSSKDVTSSDYGRYNSYAGGAYRTHTNGHCVRYQGLIWKSGDSGSVISKFVHCG